LKYSKSIVLISLCGQVLFLAITVLMHFLRPDNNPRVNFVSEYAVGNYGWIMTVGFFSMAIAQLLLITGLLQQLKASKKSIITFSIWCIGGFLFSTFKTDIPGQQPTFSGLVLHGIAALIAFLSLGISMITWGSVFKKNHEWADKASLSRVFGLVSILLFLIFLFSPVWLRGFTERLLIGWDITWLIIISNTLFQKTFSDSSYKYFNK